MQEFKGTTDTWHYDNDTRTVGAGFVFEGGAGYLDGDLVAKILPLLRVEKMEANGYLIAAAPELLEACLRMRNQLYAAGYEAEAGSMNPTKCLLAQVEVAIAKALGQ